MILDKGGVFLLCRNYHKYLSCFLNNFHRIFRKLKKKYFVNIDSNNSNKNLNV